MKKLFLETDQKEKNRILSLHRINKKNNSVNEQFGGLLRNVGRTTLNVLEDALLSLSFISKSGFKNLDEILRNFSSFSKSQRGEIITTMFRNLEGSQKDVIGRIIAKDNNLIKNFFKETEEATRDALRQSGKLADDEIESIIRGHKFNTTGSASGKWSLNVSKSGSVTKTALQVVDNTKETLLPALRQSSGKPILLKPTQEKVLKNAVLQISNSGKKLSWKDLINEFKRELKITGAVTLFFISAGLYDWMNKTGVEGLPPKEEIVKTEVKQKTDSKLGDRVLRSGSRGSDVKDLQTKLVYYGYDLGNFGPNNNGVDGKYGPKTIKAVKEFQKDAGIKVDGLFGPESLKALNKTNIDNIPNNTNNTDPTNIDNDFEKMA